MNATLLCLALLVPGYGEKEIKGRIRDAGGVATNSGGIVEMARATTDADLDELLASCAAFGSWGFRTRRLPTRACKRCPVCGG